MHGYLYLQVSSSKTQPGDWSDQTVNLVDFLLYPPKSSTQRIYGVADFIVTVNIDASFYNHCFC